MCVYGTILILYVQCVDIGEIVDRHCLNFLIIKHVCVTFIVYIYLYVWYPCSNFLNRLLIACMNYDIVLKTLVKKK